jgi:hypothetical protein
MAAVRRHAKRATMTMAGYFCCIHHQRVALKVLKPEGRKVASLLGALMTTSRSEGQWVDPLERADQSAILATA